MTIDWDQLFAPAYGSSCRSWRRRGAQPSSALGAPVDHVDEVERPDQAYELTARPGGTTWSGAGGLGGRGGLERCSRTARRGAHAVPRRCRRFDGEAPRPTTARAAGAPRARAWSSRCSPATTASTTRPRAFERAGAVPDARGEQSDARPGGRVHRRRWRRPSATVQIVMIPGGFSGGDEPDGSGEVHHRVSSARPQ